MNAPLAQRLALIGYASGLGARDPGCADGPVKLRAAGIDGVLRRNGIAAYWGDMLFPDPRPGESLRQTVENLNRRLQQRVATVLRRGERPLVYGGDHTSAAGTWSGVTEALSGRRLGLLWIDAHLDAHTPETTHSGLLHGMPLAVLLGYLGSAGPGKAALSPEHVSVVGVRSYEPEEAHLLRDLEVRIYTMEEIARRGLRAVMQEAHALVRTGTDAYGITADVDAIDPDDAPGVGTPEAGGLRARELTDILAELVAEAPPLALEIAEFNPHRDLADRTLRVIGDLSHALAGVRSSVAAG
jgi:arginase